MEQLLNWSATRVALGLMLAVGVVLAGFALLSWRAPLLRKLGLRNSARRPLRAALIVSGLMLSTMVIGSAFSTGDALTHTLHTLVAGSLGSVDEVIVLNPPRNRLRDRVQALTEPGFGGLAAAGLDPFDQTQLSRLQQATASSAAIAGVAPAMLDRVTVIHGETQQLQSAQPLLAVAAPLPDTFGPLETAEGTLVALDALASNEIVINAAAADSFGAVAGQSLTILRGETPWNVRIHAVTENAGIGGSQPLLLVPLADYQRLTGRENLINLLLVANQGGTASVTRSAAAARELRGLLVNRPVAQELHALLAQPDLQRGLREAEGWLQGSERERLAALRAAAAQPELTDEFISLISEPRTRQRLLALSWRMNERSDGFGAYELLQNLTTLSVLEVKQIALDQASEYGAVVTTVFLVLGVFSIAASILLIFLIFALLAADRGAELATMRALGMRRSQIIGLFLFEGMAYALLGGVVGALVSLGSGYLIAISLAQGLAPFGVQLDPYVAPTSLVIALSGGVLLTFGTMLLAAWRVSRMAIVAGARGELVDESQRWRVGLGVALLAGAALAWWLGRASSAPYVARHPLLDPTIVSLALLGGLCCVQPLLSTYGSRFEAVTRLLARLTGVGIVAVWLRLLLRVPDARSAIATQALTIALAGVVLILATVWTISQSIGPLLRLLDRGLAPLGRVRAVVRPAASYLGQQRWRTGMTIVMFGMIVLVMVLALTLIDVMVSAYAAEEPPVAGYDLRAHLNGGGSLGDVDAALAAAPAVSRDTFRSIGSIAWHEASVVAFGVARSRWQDTTLAIVDDGFLSGIEAGLDWRAAPSASDAAVWAALRDQPGTAVVARQLPTGALLPPADQQTDQPVTIWVRPPGAAAPVKLRVIGAIDARSALDLGIYISQTTASQMGIRSAGPQSYFFAVRPGVRVRDAAEGLRVSFVAQSLNVSTLGETQRLIQSVRLLLVRIVQGFMGLGLLAGVAALGLLGVQAVLERRQQLGALRALGFTRWQTRATLAFESGIVAVLGILVGVVLGLVLARSVVSLLAASYPELRLTVPWRDILLTAGIAWLGSSLAIALAAWQAGRVAPAEALRSSS